MGVFWSTILGLAAGLGIGLITEYYTGFGTKPVKSIVDQSVTGAATNIIAGVGVGIFRPRLGRRRPHGDARHG